MRLHYFLITILISATLLIFLLYDKEPETSVFYSPHADDETLSLGPSILRQIEKGNEVAVVLLSHGEASQSFLKTNRSLEEKGLTPITRKEFGESRVKEFKKAVQAMGVKPSHVYIFDLPDGGFEEAEVLDIMELMNERYPDARHHALSYLDPHHDHAASGKALKDMVEQGAIQSALYYLPVQEYEHIPYDGVYTVPHRVSERYLDSMNAYSIWDPQNGLYSIGYTSVKPYFEASKKYRESRWHK
jgi:LmbE family N-acetylglucosaminyl deacetylase